MLRALAEIDLNVLADNFKTIKARVSGQTRMLCVVKADAYGHGAVPVARHLEMQGTDFFGVVTTDEGIELREHGITKPILVMGGVMPWDDVESFWEHRLTPAVADLQGLTRLVSAAANRRQQIKIHVKVDTGMGRIGVGQNDLDGLIAMVCTSDRVRVEGVMSHFSSSEVRDAYGLSQIDRFRDVVALLRKNGIEPEIAHMANGGAVCQYPESHFDMVRVGIMLYGAYPDRTLAEKISVRPVMRVVSHVAYVREFPAGSPLSYGRTFITKRTTKVACVAMGYADGVPRALSNKGSVLIKGRRCPIVGRVCMDFFLADITDMADVADVAPGEEAILIGASGSNSISPDEVAEQVGTIPYEILCGISRRVPRAYA
jgi:alanine racemase